MIGLHFGNAANQLILEPMMTKIYYIMFHNQATMS